MTSLPEIEAIIRSPLGTVRAWIAPDGGVRTSISLEFGGENDADTIARQMAAVLAQVTTATRRMAVQSGSPIQTSGFNEWFAARCVVDQGSRELTRDLYADYMAFAERPVSARVFGDCLRDRSIGVAGKNATGLKYRGPIRLIGRQPPMAAPPAPLLRPSNGPLGIDETSVSRPVRFSGANG